MRKVAGISLGVAALLAAVAAALVFGETATVTLLLRGHEVRAQVYLTGSPGSAYLPTRHYSVQLTDTLQAPTSAVTVGSTYATGEVVFWWYAECRVPPCASFDIPAGYEVLTDAGVAYKTLADVLLTEALDSQLGAGEQRTGDAVSATYEVVESTPDGFVKLKGTAAGVAIPRVVTGALQKRIASMRVVEARAEIGRAYPDASIQVRVSPAWMPWLPALPARIEFRVGAFSPSSPA